MKAIGGGHSFTDAAMTDGHLMSLDGMKRVLARRRHGRDRAGRDPAPRPERAAASNVVWRCRTSATSTAVDRRRHLDRDARHRCRTRQPGDHDRRCSNSSPVTARWCGPTSAPTPNCCVWPGSASARSASSPRSPCGAFRRSTSMRVETIEPVADVIADFGNVMRSTDHVEFYWMPGGRRCQVKRNTRTDAAGRAAAEAGLRPRQVDRREPRVRHRLPRRATLPIARPEGGQARHVGGRRT